MLARLRRLTLRRRKLDAEWRQAVKDAHADGQSLRAIAEAADVSHVHVRRIVRND